jgi:hypothetical protein
MDEIQEVNEDGNYVIEMNVSNQWLYITTEYSFSVAAIVMCNLQIATKQKCRVVSKRNNQILSETID